MKQIGIVSPWVSLQERRPPVKTRCLFMDSNGIPHIGQANIDGESATVGTDGSFAPTEELTLTHWMVIPPLENEGNRSPWHPYPAEKPPQIPPEISARVIAHVPWGECFTVFYKDGEWNGCPDLWAKKIDKWMEIPE